MRTLNFGLLLTALGALWLIPACESTQAVETRPSKPGALPSTVAEVTPRLNASTYLAHGHLLERQGNLEGALAQYRQALHETPDMVTAHNRLGITLDKLGRHGEAAAAYGEAIRREPNAAHLHNNLGFCLYLDGKYGEAQAALGRAVELQPEFRRAHMNLGLVLARLGRDDEAVTQFALAGTQADAYYNLAVVQAELGRYAEAARALEQALALNPGFAEARKHLREIARMAAAAEAATAAVAESAAQAPVSESPADAGATAPVALAADQQVGPPPVLDTQQAVETLLLATGARIGRLTPEDNECLGELIRELFAARTATPPWPNESVGRVELLLAQLESE